VKVGIINVTGYAGIELARILLQHGEVEISGVTGRSAVGKKLAEVYPQMWALDLTITDELTDSADIVFSALPHVSSAEKLAPLVRQGVKAVDISGDFRLKEKGEYEVWYKSDHAAPDLLQEAVYGLPELNRDEVRLANLVANPGCYPTAALLALAPAVAAGIIEPDIIVDAKSGVSGAGRKSQVEYSYSEVNESINAYSLDGHRHQPEIGQELGRLDEAFRSQITFLPHLVPMTRGLLASCYAPIKRSALGIDLQSAVMDVYSDFYKDEPFVHIGNNPPATKHTVGSNFCLLYPTVELRTNRLIVISCIDNLVKGAAGQAVQNMNIMSGLSETQGLDNLTIYP
jgi:N-acetyl-gamma-glutamyl-phosphate reductase